MGLSREDRRLLSALEEGLALVPRPFEELGRRCGMSEEAVIIRLSTLLARGVIRRFGLVLRHHDLGYRANAMVVFEVPEAHLREAAERLAALPFVTLCYRREPRPPEWPYNLYCMIHGRERGTVERQIETATRHAGLEGLRRAVLFSRRRFKQCGARYGSDRGESGERARWTPSIA